MIAEYENVRENIKRLCKEKGMTQSELAKKSYFSQALISFIVNGKYNPTKETLEAIAKALGVSADELKQNKPPSCENLIENIKNLCYIRGMTQGNLANRSSISITTVNFILNRKHTPAGTTVKLIANALEISVEELMTSKVPSYEDAIKNIKRVCKEKGMTQSELAKKIGVSRQTVISIMNGKSKATVTTIKSIAKVLGVLSEDIFK